MCSGGKRFWKKHPCKRSLTAASPFRRYPPPGGLPERRYRLSASAKDLMEAFSGKCVGSYAFGLSESHETAPFLWEKRKAMENLDRMGIAHLHRHCFRELSGGQQQRVLLARALCAAKHLLILDEPIASLDPIAAKEFYEQIQRLHTELHMAVLMVSHDMKNALSYGEKILHLDTKQLFFGTTDAYLATGTGQRFGERGQQISCT